MTNFEDKDLEAGEIGGFSEPGSGRAVPRFNWADKELSDVEIKDTIKCGSEDRADYYDKVFCGDNIDGLKEIRDGLYDNSDITTIGFGDSIEAGYDLLWNELIDAFNQAAIGKGRERHANDEPFEQQKILVIQRWIGNSPVGGLIFQAAKKTIEASRLEHEAAIHELSGATVYLQAAKIRLRELLKEEK